MAGLLFAGIYLFIVIVVVASMRAAGAAKPAVSEQQRRGSRRNLRLNALRQGPIVKLLEKILLVPLVAGIVGVAIVGVYDAWRFVHWIISQH